MEQATLKRLLKLFFEKQQSPANMKEGGDEEQNGTLSEDPFNIYELINKKDENNKGVNNSEDNLKYPLDSLP